MVLANCNASLLNKLAWYVQLSPGLLTCVLTGFIWYLSITDQVHIFTCQPISNSYLFLSSVFSSTSWYPSSITYTHSRENSLIHTTTHMPSTICFTSIPSTNQSQPHVHTGTLMAMHNYLMCMHWGKSQQGWLILRFLHLELGWCVCFMLITSVCSVCFQWSHSAKNDKLPFKRAARQFPFELSSLVYLVCFICAGLLLFLLTMPHIHDK
jgi:hypothetical protein